MPPEENNDTGAAGGSGDQTGGTTDNQQQGGGPDDLGDAGKKALDSERASRRAAEKRLGEVEKELTRFRESSMSEQERAIEKAKTEARAEAATAFNRRLIQAEVRAAASGKLSDPEDAIRFLDLDDFAIDSDGEVDKKAISVALEGLLKAKPYLAVSGTRPTGDADQGARRSGSSGPDMDQLLRAAVRGQ